jgi:hypothetical protein
MTILPEGRMRVVGCGGLITVTVRAACLSGEQKMISASHSKWKRYSARSRLKTGAAGKKIGYEKVGKRRLLMGHMQHLFPIDPEYSALRERSRSRHERRPIGLYALLSDEILHA